MKASIGSVLVPFLTFGIIIGITNAQGQPESNFRRKPGGLQRTYNRAKTTTEQPVQISSDDEESDQCPEPNGFFADADQCDKYHHCSDNKITEKLCPDGMVFNDYDIDQEKCDLPYNIDCSKRSKLQTPIVSLHCPRLNGYFGHEEKNVCDKFYYCVDGMFNMITCPAGLVFNPKTGICTWPDEAHKKGCSSEEIFKFTCPKVTEMEAQTHPRYADPEDCQFFYVCINGETPRRNGCKLGQAFDDQTKRCNWARKIPECADWYKDRLTDKQLDDLENPPTPPSNKSKINKISRRKQAQAQRKAQQEQEARERDEEE